MDVREHAVTSSRGRLLRELEEAPPQYLLAAIGPPPRVDRKMGNEQLRREWKRLALSIEDFRGKHHVTDRVRALGSDATIPAHRDLSKRVSSFRRDRRLGQGRER